MLTFRLCVHILLPARTSDNKTFKMTYVYIPVMPLALFVPMCCDVASLQLVCVVRPLFRGIRCFMLCIYVLVLYRPLCFTSGL